MKLEIPETRPFRSEQDTNNVAVSGMGPLCVPLFLWVFFPSTHVFTCFSRTLRTIQPDGIMELADIKLRSQLLSARCLSSLSLTSPIL